MPTQEEIKRLIYTNSRRLQKLKEKKAARGIDVDPSVPIEIEDLQADIEHLQKELHELERAEDSPSKLSLLLEKVESFWINRLLERSLSQNRPMELELKYQSGAVEDPWDKVVQDVHQADFERLPVR
jgi:hypothetical protein